MSVDIAFRFLLRSEELSCPIPLLAAHDHTVLSNGKWKIGW